LVKTFAESVLEFFDSLDIPDSGQDVEFINSYGDPAVKSVVSQFYLKYFNDVNPRTFIIGINPGRFGGGLTGISFTDPIVLSEVCDIPNNLGHQKELSSRFIYTMIDAFGGPLSFYSKFYLTALFPLAIVKNGKNYNYYDTPNLLKYLEDHIVSSLREQIKCGAVRERAICLGKRNFKEMKRINDKHQLFGHLEVVEHPRYIMQYKLKQLPQYIEQYLKVLNNN
jgi:hypothetical protein